MKQPPCFNCEIRENGCHSNCDMYKHWKQVRTEANEYEKMRRQDEFESTHFMKPKRGTRRKRY